MAKIDVKLLGQIECQLGSKSRLTLATRKAEVLLAYLALAPDARHPRDRLSNLLWSDRSEEQAKNSLRQALSAIKKSLANLDAEPLVIDRSTVMLQSNQIKVDARVFIRLAGYSDMDSLTRAAALYRGEFLDGIIIRDAASQEWLAHERDRFKRLIVEVLHTLCQLQIGEGQYRSAIESAERLVVYDPLQEAGWRLLMQSYHANGQRNHALVAYKRCSEILNLELGIEPESQTRNLRAQITDEKSGTAFLYPSTVRTKSGSTDQKDNPLPQSDANNSILVLPFENLSGDPEQEYFSDGITDSIILHLSLFDPIIVKSRHTSFTFKHTNKSLEDIGEELNVQFVVEGSIRKGGDRVRINVQLIEVATGNQLWGKRYDADLQQIFSLEEELSQSIASTVSGQIERNIRKSAIRKPVTDLKCYDYFMRGIHHSQLFTPDGVREGKAQFAKCLEIDPDYADAHALLAAYYDVEIMENWTTDRAESLRLSGEHARMALELDPQSAFVQSFVAENLIYQREFERADVHADKAIALNPTLPDAHSYKAWILAAMGRFDEALGYADHSIELDPYHPYSGWIAGEVYRHIGEFEKAIKAFRSIPHLPTSVQGQIAACLVGLDQLDKAKLEMRRYHELAKSEMPRYPASEEEWKSYWYDYMPYKHQEDFERFYALLLKAGLCDYLDKDTAELPSIAVLPFENMSDDLEQEFFASGIASDIINILSKFKNMRVVSGYSTTLYKDRKTPVPQIAEQLDVRYILDGSVRKSGKKIRVNTQLIDSRSGENCWVEQFDRDLDDIFAVQDEITMNIATAMKVRLTDGERTVAIASDIRDYKVWEYVTLAAQYADSYVRENLAEAKRLSLLALEVNDKSVAAWSLLGWTHWQEAYAGWIDSIETSINEARDAARKALELDPEYLEALTLKSFIHVAEDEPESAIEAGMKAVAVAPGNSDAHAMTAFALVYGGKLEEALHHYEISLRLCPFPPAWMLLVGGSIYQQSGKLQHCIQTYRKCIDMDPESPLCRFYLMDALIEAGDLSNAEQVAKEIRLLDSAMKVGGLILTYNHDKRERERFKTNLAKMGFLEGDESSELSSASAHPSLAVLPFENMSGDPEQQHFSDGITSDIITTLSRFRGMRVVARHSTLAYQDGNTPIAQIAAEQDVRYILEGSARKSGNRVRVTAQVIDTVTEENIWVDTYDRNLDDFFAVQDEITKSISVALRVHLWEGGRARFNARGTTSVNAWEYCTQAADLTDSYIRENVAEARRLAKLSLEIDPEYCFAWVILGWTYWQEAYCTWTDSIEGALREAENASFRALQIDPDDADALILSGTIHSLRSRPELAVEACAKAVSIAP
ncbi:MAG: BTAD domain-containing putative transcriptional regulator, partial [Gammaproteobacteria bacterium]